MYNLVGYVLNYLSDLESNSLLYNHQFIPDNEVHLKIGGDHGGGSFKMSFQIADVEHPNQPQNTVIFSILEAKDYKRNLMLCLERFKLHIAKFTQVKCNEKNFRIFLFGDYGFLANMYGISGASGRHPCLWCHISSDMMNVPSSLRLNKFSLRTLESLQNNLKDFHEIYQDNLKYAKNVFNVINEVFFDIPLEQVCLSGLHITLDVYLKLFKLFELFAKETDSKIAGVLALENNEISNEEFQAFVNSVKRRNRLEEEVAELSNK